MLYCERKPLEEELCRIKSVVRKNNSFEKYITSFRLRVKTPDGTEIPVNKDTLVGYADTTLPLLSSPKLLRFKAFLKLITLKTEPVGEEQQSYLVQKSC